MKRRLIIFLPLALLVIFIAAVGWRLSSPPNEIVRSRLAGQPMPEFALPPMVEGRPGLSSADLATGQPRLVNIFASWCIPCIAEAPNLMKLKAKGVTIDAIAIRDRPEDVKEFLTDHGDPFTRIGNDTGSKVQLLIGSAGVPETFVVDGRGVIRYQHVGAIADGDVDLLLAELEKAR